MKQQNVEVIGKLKKEGLTIEEIAEKLSLSVEYVDEALKIIKSTPMQIGYFDKILSQKKEQNLSLKGTQEALVLNIRALWKMVEMLEQKKKYLDQLIEGMEKYVKKGSNVADIFIEYGVKIDE